MNSWHASPRFDKFHITKEKTSYKVQFTVDAKIHNVFRVPQMISFHGEPHVIVQILYWFKNASTGRDLVSARILIEKLSNILM